MCGIAGFCNPQAEYLSQSGKWETVLREMNKTQKHRGPDDEGVFLTDKCGFSHVRLSIIDLAGGHQPMVSTCGNRSCAIVYNGEIYNMQELKKSLQHEGAIFKTESDTEVILQGFMIHGAEFVNRLNGIFAFAIWDSLSDRTYLFRDRLGVKPLFFSKHDGTIVFASEIKGIFAYPDITPKIDRNGLCSVFGLGPAKPCGSGVFKGVDELLPGHYMTIDHFGITDHKYWSLESRPHEDNYEETVQKTSALISSAVKMQMLSDIPISTFLSGGVDSSLVTAICAKELAKQNKTLNTFSFDFVGNDIYFKSNSFQPSQDRPYVDLMVDFAKTNHYYLECDTNELADYLYKAVDARDLPCMTDVESSMLYFCSKVAPINSVTLTGECADEIFGGYPWFHKKEAFENDAFPWSPDLSPRKLLLKDEVKDALDIDGFVRDEYFKSVSETPRLIGEDKVEARRREIAYLNLKWFMITLLDRMDRTSMYSGLEARVPFADHRIVEYVWNVPWEMKNYRGIVKGLLRNAGEKFLPRDVLYRKKSPYPKTYNPKYEATVSERLTDILNSCDSPINALIDRQKVESFISTPSDYGKPWYGQLMAGPQLIAYMLQINYWLEKYNIEISL